MDYLGTLGGEAFAGGEGRDQMIELGSGRLVPGFEEQLTGAKAGDERTVTVTFPDDYGAEELAGKEAEFAVTVKEVKAKELPELDDDLADRGRLRHARRAARRHPRAAHARRRAAASRPSSARPRSTPPWRTPPSRSPTRSSRRASRELWDQMLHSLSHQGISKEMYLQISGRSEEDIVAEGKTDAERQLKREAVLAAVVEAECDRAVRGRDPRRARGGGAAGAAPAPRSCWSG